MSTHARLSPSDHRWPHCPGSIRESNNYPDINSPAAIDGTGSHLLLELVLTTGHPIEYYLGRLIEVNHEDKPTGWLIDQDRIERVRMVLNYIERRKTELSKQFPECRIDVESESTSNPGYFFNRLDWWGTTDVTISIYNRFDCCIYIEVIDLKDGRIYVDEKNNPQLLAYLGGKILSCGSCLNGRMTIIQPKTKTPVRYVDITSELLKIELMKLNQAATLTDDLNALLIADNDNGNGHCRWCPHKINCVALKTKTKERLKTVVGENKALFETIQDILGDLSKLENSKLSEFLDTEGPMMDVYKRAKEEAEKRIDSGRPIPGYAKIPGNSRQIWKGEEEEIAKALINRRLKKDEIYIAKFISPVQVMKHSQLTKKQKEDIRSKFIEVIVGAMSLQKVKYDTAQTGIHDLTLGNKPTQSFDEIINKKSSFI